MSRGYVPPVQIVLPRISVDILSFQLYPPKPDSVREDVYFAVPFETLTFLFAVDKYVCDYAAIVQVTDVATGKLISDKYQTYSVIETTGQHEQRSEKGIAHADAEQLTLNLQASHEYDVRLLVRDLSSKHETDTTLRVHTRAFDQSTPNLSDLIVYRNRTSGRIQPAIGGDLSLMADDNSGVFANFYNPPPNFTLGLVTEIYALKENSDESSEPILRSAQLIRTPSPIGPSSASSSILMAIFHDQTFDELWMGRYILRMYVMRNISDTSKSGFSNLKDASLAWSERHVNVRSIGGIPMNESDLAQSLEQLRLIATGSEWDSLSAPTNPKQQRDAILSFWKNRNPNPAERYNRPMEVFYARIAYANMHFGSGFKKGWNSDRGRVYVALGAPDYIDKRDLSATQKPFEVWEYSRQHTRYVFVDEYMLGDYRLTGSFPPSGIFVWDR